MRTGGACQRASCSSGPATTARSAGPSARLVSSISMCNVPHCITSTQWRSHMCRAAQKERVSLESLESTGKFEEEICSFKNDTERVKRQCFRIRNSNKSSKYSDRFGVSPLYKAKNCVHRPLIILLATAKAKRTSNE